MLGPCTGAHQAPAVFYNQVFLVYDPSSATSLLSSVTSNTTRVTKKYTRTKRLVNLKLLLGYSITSAGDVRVKMLFFKSTLV